MMVFYFLQNQNLTTRRTVTRLITIEEPITAATFAELPLMDHWVNNHSPVDIDLTDLTQLSTISRLQWLDSDKMPREMNVENTGYTLNVNAKYSERRPTLTGSALRCPYEFWCFHFHWGAERDNGSEHRIMGKSFPMEIHLMFYNVSYANVDEALDAEDGILALVYVCQLVPEENLIMKDLITKSAEVETRGKSVKINSFPLSSLFDDNLEEYFMYWSTNDGGDHDLKKKSLWIVSPNPVSVNESQLTRIRSVKGPDGKCIASNCRSPPPSFQRNTVFSVGRPEIAVSGLLRRANAVEPPARFDRTVMIGARTAPATIVMVSPVSGDDADRPMNLEGRPEQLQWQTPEVCTEGTADEKERRSGTEAKTVDASESTKDIVMRSIDSLLTDLVDETKVEHSENGIQNRPAVHKTHRDGVRMTKTALRREKYIKNIQSLLKQKNETRNKM